MKHLHRAFTKLADDGKRRERDREMLQEQNKNRRSEVLLQLERLFRNRVVSLRNGASSTSGFTSVRRPMRESSELRSCSICVSLLTVAHGLGLELAGWSPHLTICTDGVPQFESIQIRDFNQCGIRLRHEKIKMLSGSTSSLEGIIFENGTHLKCSAIFFTLEQRQRSDLPVKLGCEFTEKGSVKTASQDVQFAIVAAAEGAQAAFAINTALLKEDLYH